MFDLGSEIRIFKKRNLGLEWWNAIDDSIWDPRSESSSRFMEHDRMCGTVFRFILVIGVFYLNLICPVHVHGVLHYSAVQHQCLIKHYFMLML